MMQPLLNMNDRESYSEKDLPDKQPVNWLHDIGLVQLAMVVLFGIFTSYAPISESGHGGFNDPIERENYELFKDVSVMIFVGFGYLMTFLRKYGYGAIGFTYLISAIVFQFTILNVGFWRCFIGDNFPGQCGSLKQGAIQLDVEYMIQGLFGAAAVMISFGGLIGKISPTQLTVMALVEVVLYCLNNHIVTTIIGTVDAGGSIVIHTFGAYFGLAASYFISPIKLIRDFSANESCYHSDLFSFIGTLFLWIYWPSFNTATVDPDLQGRAVLNTVCSLCAATVVSFYASRVLKGNFDAVDIQNATLAGGVAMGTACNLSVSPMGALIIGSIAGFVSCYGYARLQTRLDYQGVHDTCGIHNLHGMPGILGGLTSAVVAALYYSGDQDLFPKGKNQWVYQLAGLACTLAISIVTGALTGYFLNKFLPAANISYTDECFWNIPTSDGVFTKSDTDSRIVRTLPALGRARKNWAKIRRSVKVSGLFKSLGQSFATNRARLAQRRLSVTQTSPFENFNFKFVDEDKGNPGHRRSSSITPKKLLLDTAGF